MQVEPPPRRCHGKRGFERTVFTLRYGLARKIDGRIAAAFGGVRLPLATAEKRLLPAASSLNSADLPLPLHNACRFQARLSPQLVTR